MSFHNYPTVKQTDHGKWRLEKPLLYVSRTGKKYRIPAGFYTDGASIPRIFQNVINPEGRCFRSAILHDWLYYTGSVGRAQADRLFREALESDRICWIQREIMYLAVRYFGGLAYNKYRKLEEKT